MIVLLKDKLSRDQGPWPSPLLQCARPGSLTSQIPKGVLLSAWRKRVVRRWRFVVLNTLLRFRIHMIMWTAIPFARWQWQCQLSSLIESWVTTVFSDSWPGELGLDHKSLKDLSLKRLRWKLSSLARRLIWSPLIYRWRECWCDSSGSRCNFLMSVLPTVRNLLQYHNLKISSLHSITSLSSFHFPNRRHLA